MINTSYQLPYHTNIFLHWIQSFMYINKIIFSSKKSLHEHNYVFNQEVTQSHTRVLKLCWGANKQETDLLRRECWWLWLLVSRLEIWISSQCTTKKEADSPIKIAYTCIMYTGKHTQLFLWLFCFNIFQYIYHQFIIYVTTIKKFH